MSSVEPHCVCDHFIDFYDPETMGLCEACQHLEIGERWAVVERVMARRHKEMEQHIADTNPNLRGREPREQLDQ